MKLVPNWDTAISKNCPMLSSGKIFGKYDGDQLGSRPYVCGAHSSIVID